MKRRLYAVPALALSLALLSAPIEASAKKGEANTGAITATETIPIEDTGITAFDSVFSKVRAILDTVKAAEGRLIGAQDKIAAAVGQPAGTPVRMSMWELKQTAGGPIQVQMNGTPPKPTLTIGGAGDAEAKAAINKINGAVGEVAKIVTDLGKLPAQVMELVDACKALPAQLNPQLLTDAGLTPMQLPKVAKTVGNNVKAITKTPDQIAGLVTASKTLLEGIPQGLAATEPPTADAVAAKKADKKSKKSKDKGKSKGDTGVAVASNTQTGQAIDQAMTLFGEAEVAEALQVLSNAKARLVMENTPISTQELGSLYQTTALVHLVDGNAAAATSSVTQALIVDPGSAAPKDLGPDYARLHKAMQKSGVIRTIEVAVDGSGQALISGQQVDGGSSIKVGEGTHLIQVQRNGSWSSELRYLEDGAVISL